MQLGLFEATPSVGAPVARGFELRRSAHPVARDAGPCICGCRLIYRLPGGRLRCHFCDREWAGRVIYRHPVHGELKILRGRCGDREVVTAWWESAPGGWSRLAGADWPELATVEDYRRHMEGLAARGVITIG